MKETMQENPSVPQATAPGVSRRRFLTYAGALAGAGVLLDACTKKPSEESGAPGTLSLGYGDNGLLNYAYLLKQMCTAFYIKVCDLDVATGLTYNELLVFKNIRDHEITHREFYKNFLDKVAIPLQTFDFSSIDFKNRERVLITTQTFEDVSVNAYNGMASYLNTPELVQQAAKIATVEARHSAYIRNLHHYGSFQETIDENGIDKGTFPKDVIKNSITPYLNLNITLDGL